MWGEVGWCCRSVGLNACQQGVCSKRVGGSHGSFLMAGMPVRRSEVVPHGRTHAHMFCFIRVHPSHNARSGAKQRVCWLPHLMVSPASSIKLLTYLHVQDQESDQSGAREAAQVGRATCRAFLVVFCIVDGIRAIGAVHSRQSFSYNSASIAVTVLKAASKPSMQGSDRAGWRLTHFLAAMSLGVNKMRVTWGFGSSV